MIIQHLKYTLEIFDVNEKLISMNVSNNYSLTPEEGKVIRNKKTKEIFRGVVVLGTGQSVEDYEEIDA